MGFQKRIVLPILGVAIFIHILTLGAFHFVYEPEHDPNAYQNKLLEQFKQSRSEALAAAVTNKTSSKEQQHSIPVFYNLFVANASETSRVLELVSEQRSFLRPYHQPFFIQSMGQVELEIPDTTVLGHRVNGTEMITLHSLWDYCQTHNAVEKVVYLHSKGSSRASQANADLRKFLTKGALSEECALADANECNVCSSRFSPIPHPHTSGNMWLARCDYIQKLIDPYDFEESMQHIMSNCTAKGRASCDGRLRFSAEHWIHSHPSVKPCDLYPDPEFTWDYDGIPANGTLGNIELAQAPRFDLIQYVKWGKCALRGTYLYPRLDEYWRLYQELPNDEWWGWNFLQTDKSWIPPEERGARFWRNKDLCWQGGVLNVTEMTMMQASVKARSTKNDESRKESVKQPGEDKVKYIAKNNTNVCPSGSRIEQGPGVDGNKTAATVSSIAKARLISRQLKGTKKRVLIMAIVPRERRHIAALWTQLECFTIGVDSVILAAPKGREETTKKIIDFAKEKIPQFRSGEVSIRAEYFVNDRYDVGLWCDGLDSLHTDEFDEFGLINDSVFAMHSSSEVFDALSSKNVSLTSSGYSYTPKFFEGNDDPVHFWVESIYRGFTKEGIQIFREYSCVPKDHPFFCPEEADNKACIVNNFEHDLAIQYPCDKVYGIYPSDAPSRFFEKSRHRMWARNTPYWRAMKSELQFPLAKVNQINQVGTQLTKVKECMKHSDGVLEMLGH